MLRFFEGLFLLQCLCNLLLQINLLLTTKEVLLVIRQLVLKNLRL